MHRKSGNGKEEGSETKHALDRAQTKAPCRWQTQCGEPPALSSCGKTKKKPASKDLTSFFCKVKVREKCSEFLILTSIKLHKVFHRAIK